MGRVFNLIVRVLAIPGFQDTQCGFKSFRNEVGKEVFAEQTMPGWAFDVEALFIALRRGYKVIDVPINCTSMPIAASIRCGIHGVCSRCLQDPAERLARVYDRERVDKGTGRQGN